MKLFGKVHNRLPVLFFHFILPRPHTRFCSLFPSYLCNFFPFPLCTFHLISLPFCLSPFHSFYLSFCSMALSSYLSPSSPLFILLFSCLAFHISSVSFVPLTRILPFYSSHIILSLYTHSSPFSHLTFFPYVFFTSPVTLILSPLFSHSSFSD